LLSIAPIYWAPRLLGLDSESSYQLLMAALSLLNYGSFYLLLRRGLRFGPIPSAAAAYLFAFGAPRLAHFSHQQLFTQFFTVLCCYFLARFYSAEGARDRSSSLFFAASCLAAQAYSSFYLVWLFVLFSSIYLAVLLANRGERAGLSEKLRSSRLSAALSICWAVLLLYPLLYRYFEVARQLGFRELEDVRGMVPSIFAWLHAGRENLLYGRLSQFMPAEVLMLEHEKRLSIGVITWLCALYGLLSISRFSQRSALVAASVLCIAVSSSFAGYSAWGLVYGYFPGAAAVRAPGRIVLMLLIPLSIGIAAFLSRIRSSPAVCAVIMAIMVLEQISLAPHYSKPLSQRLAGEIRTALSASKQPCAAFFYIASGGRFPEWKYQLDAMWGSLASGVPAINGYSGNVPRGWNLRDNNIQNKTELRSLRTEAIRWCELNGLDPGTVCIVREARRRRGKLRAAGLVMRQG